MLNSEAKFDLCSVTNFYFIQGMNILYNNDNNSYFTVKQLQDSFDLNSI